MSSLPHAKKESSFHEEISRSSSTDIVGGKKKKKKDKFDKKNVVKNFVKAFDAFLMD